VGVGVRIGVQVFRMEFYTHTLGLGSMAASGIFFRVIIKKLELYKI